jgi:two-component system sensor histidine kinase DegS
VATHAQASQVLVGFDFNSDRLQVMVDDDGIGFDPQMALNTPGDHLGLIGMKERADALDALLNVDSAVGEGTRIELRLSTAEYLED